MNRKSNLGNLVTLVNVIWSLGPRHPRPLNNLIDEAPLDNRYADNVDMYIICRYVDNVDNAHM